MELKEAGHYLGPPKLHMFLFKSEKILPDLVIDQALRNIAPAFRWCGVMNDQKQ